MDPSIALLAAVLVSLAASYDGFPPHAGDPMPNNRTDREDTRTKREIRRLQNNVSHNGAKSSRRHRCGPRARKHK